MQKVDVAVIGAGTAGLNARSEVARCGGSVLLIEHGPYGTTCARVGCMPSKLLVAAAERAQAVRDAGVFGVHAAGGLEIDGRAVMARVQKERDRFANGMVRSTEALPEDQRLRGHARFVGPTSLEVEGERIEANAVVIAAGSSPWLPPPFDDHADRVLTSDTIFELEDLPESLAVIGTGVIALELGQAMAQLGVEVAFFNPFDDLGPFSDPDLMEAARATLGAGLELHLGAEMQGVEATGPGLRLTWRTADGERHARRFAAVLVAAGRRPNLAGLGLEATGLRLDDKGRPGWNRRTTQCGDLPIFMAGDIAGGTGLLHEAADEGRIAGANALLYPAVEAHNRRAPLAIAFTDPQMAIVGQRFADLDQGEVAIGAVSFANQGRATVMAKNEGLVRLYARRGCGTFLGAEMLGPQVEHMAHLLAWSCQQELSVPRMLEMPFYHPVLEEGLRTALRALAKELDMVSTRRCEDAAEQPCS
ncbi:MAG: dihydrolipoyl dehydrogenase [Geminicoccaceae bacterium]|nr:dihydrolipoyl dehydrogenase [Geminicoccaceae bacterium]